MTTARLFRNGQSQAVRLPKEFRFDGDRVWIRRLGNAVVLIPCDSSAWDLLEGSLELFSADFPAERQQPTSEEPRDPL